MPTFIRIATWNLRRPGKNSPRNPIINQKLREINADIWILTETHRAVSPGDWYEAQETQPLRWHRDGESSTTIWSRWPMTRVAVFTDQFPDSQSADQRAQGYYTQHQGSSIATCAEIATPVGPLLVYGTIITWFNDQGPDGTSRYGVEHKQSIADHTADWQRIRIAYDMPLCVGGDFNSLVQEPIGKLRAGTKEARELLRTALHNNGLTCVTDTFEYSIDHLCLSADWATYPRFPMQWQAFYDSNKPVSDHKGVCVDICIDDEH